MCVWDTSTGRLLSSLPPQQGSRIKEIVFDGACRRAVLLLYDGTVSVMDLKTGACLQQVWSVCVNFPWMRGQLTQLSQPTYEL